MFGVSIIVMVSSRRGSFGLAGAISAVAILVLAAAGPILGRLVDKRGPRRGGAPVSAAGAGVGGGPGGVSGAGAPPPGPPPVVWPFGVTPPALGAVPRAGGGVSPRRSPFGGAGRVGRGPSPAAHPRCVAARRRWIKPALQRPRADLNHRIQEGLSVSGVRLAKTLGTSAATAQRFAETSPDLVDPELRSPPAGRCVAPCWGGEEARGMVFPTPEAARQVSPV